MTNDILQDISRILDFQYTDRDQESLRRQLCHPDDAPLPLDDTFGMSCRRATNQSLTEGSILGDDVTPGKRPFSPSLSDLSGGEFEPALNGPPRKKQRRSCSFSSSSLSEESSSSSDEDEAPLAHSRKAAPLKNGKGNVTRTTTRRTAGKGTKSKAHTAPVTKAPPTEQERADMTFPPTNGVNGHEAKVKVEDKLDDSQLTRLATGVTVDTNNAASANVCIVSLTYSHFLLIWSLSSLLSNQRNLHRLNYEMGSSELSPLKTMANRDR